ncbi:peptidylprolyl isomerase [Formosa sp. PL04]|uniref:peptidylprolyl isomerase n=1 Tax=Formosa sp. PL04 TaxID=3081755 RepID=UPI00298147ED|nr:peptidylprolyl isomerase [Formosa sp. PL04]MDW5288325.1 peptidylprolyl isomerase [Formosa sp. PL04]
MLKNLLLTGALVSSVLCYAQDSFNGSIEDITTSEQAEIFIKKNKKLKGKYFVFNKEKHNTTLAKELFETPIGRTKVYETEYNKTTYKVIDKHETMYYRASYIFINSDDLNENDLKRLKQTIYSKYNQGQRFYDLVKRYSMDKNASRGGDTGWFIDGKMPIEVENELIKNNKNHYLNTLFTVDIPDRNWHYIILKTEEPKPIEEIMVVKITEAI